MGWDGTAAADRLSLLASSVCLLWLWLGRARFMLDLCPFCYAQWLAFHRLARNINNITSVLPDSAVPRFCLRDFTHAVLPTTSNPCHANQYWLSTCELTHENATRHQGDTQFRPPLTWTLHSAPALPCRSLSLSEPVNDGVIHTYLQCKGYGRLTIIAMPAHIRGRQLACSRLRGSLASANQHNPHSC
jgi:hypothetical protein